MHLTVRRVEVTRVNFFGFTEIRLNLRTTGIELSLMCPLVFYVEYVELLLKSTTQD